MLVITPRLLHTESCACLYWYHMVLFNSIYYVNYLPIEILCINNSTAKLKFILFIFWECFLAMELDGFLVKLSFINNSMSKASQD